jgi:hypothetical protein
MNDWEIVSLHELPVRFDPAVEALVNTAARRSLQARWIRGKSEEFAEMASGDMMDAMTSWFYAMAVVQGTATVPRGVIGVLCAYFAEGCIIRRKTGEGLELRHVPPYVNIGPSAITPEFRGAGIFSRVYEYRLRILERLYDNRPEAEGMLFLSGVRGRLSDAMQRVYGEVDMLAPLISRSLFSADEWSQLGVPRDESKASEVMAIRSGFHLVGLKKTDGGPVYLRSHRGGR